MTTWLNVAVFQSFATARGSICPPAAPTPDRTIYPPKLRLDAAMWLAYCYPPESRASKAMAKKKHHLNGAEIIIEALREEQVEHIFGYPGGAVLHVYDAIYKQKDITHRAPFTRRTATRALPARSASPSSPPAPV